MISRAFPPQRPWTYAVLTWWKLLVPIDSASRASRSVPKTFTRRQAMALPGSMDSSAAVFTTRDGGASRSSVIPRPSSPRFGCERSARHAPSRPEHRRADRHSGRRCRPMAALTVASADRSSEARTRQTSRCPRAASRAASRDPRKPVAPVKRIVCVLTNVPPGKNEIVGATRLRRNVGWGPNVVDGLHSPAYKRVEKLSRRPPARFLSAIIRLSRRRGGRNRCPTQLS